MTTDSANNQRPSSAPLWRRIVMWDGWRGRLLRIGCAVPALLLAGAIGLVYVNGFEVPDRASSTPILDRSRPLMVAVGDSFIAGEGAKRYLKGTADARNVCHRANTAYPYLVAAEHRFRLLALSCSGAITADIDQRAQHPKSPDDIPGGKPQIDLLDSSSLHENASEIDYLVLSIGGNDAGFGSIVGACLNEINCQRNDRAWMTRLDAIGPKLDRVYKELAAKTPHARRIVMTYPQILVPGMCVPGLEPAEIRWVNLRFLPRLLTIISFYAGNDGFEVVDNSSAFVGARVCEDGIRVKGRAANVFSASDVAGKPSPGELLRGSFHPTERGHLLLAAQLDHELAAVKASPQPCGDSCPPVPPPNPPAPPPGNSSPFPSGTACVGTEIASDRLVTTPVDATAVDLDAEPATTFCYRDWEETWKSARTLSDGQAHVSTKHLQTGTATSIEVLTQSSQNQTPTQSSDFDPGAGNWIRTVVIAPPEDQVGAGSPFDTLLLWGLALLAFVLLLAALPWGMTLWQARLEPN